VLVLLEQSEGSPVVILEGDRGPDSNGGRQAYIQLRMTILNAYLLPTGDAGLYPSITPANPSRIVFYPGLWRRLLPARRPCALLFIRHPL
jgi:hypothetical protein